MDLDNNVEAVSLSNNHGDAFQTPNDAEVQCRTTCNSLEIPSVVHPVKMFQADVIGYSSSQSGVEIHSQSSHGKSASSKLNLSVNSVNKCASSNSSNDFKVASDSNSLGDPSKRKRMHHDYKKLSKSGYIEDKWTFTNAIKQVDGSPLPKPAKLVTSVSPKQPEHVNKGGAPGQYLARYSLTGSPLNDLGLVFVLNDNITQRLMNNIIRPRLSNTLTSRLAKTL